MAADEGSAERTRRRWWRWVLPAAVVLGVGIWWFGPQALLYDRTVDEALPEVPADQAAAAPTAGATAEPQLDRPDAEEPADEEAAPEPSAEREPTDSETSEPATAEPPVLASGMFETISTRYEGSGTATVHDLGTEQILRFTDFGTTNGPDLKVWLTTAPVDAANEQFASAEFVALGPLSGNVGNQNYTLPADVDLERFSTVVVWCERFSVAFTAAQLTPA